MKSFSYFLPLFLLSFCFVSCSGDDEMPMPSACDQSVVISENEYNTAPRDALTIINLEIMDNCLVVDFSASGCDGESWEVKLIDSGAILESFPPQRNLILSLDNQEACQAVFTRQLSFDISALQTEGSSVQLNIDNASEQIMYEY